MLRNIVSTHTLFPPIGRSPPPVGTGPQGATAPRSRGGATAATGTAHVVQVGATVARAVGRRGRAGRHPSRLSLGALFRRGPHRERWLSAAATSSAHTRRGSRYGGSWTGFFSAFLRCAGLLAGCAQLVVSHMLFPTPTPITLTWQQLDCSLAATLLLGGLMPKLCWLAAGSAPATMTRPRRGPQWARGRRASYGLPRGQSRGPGSWTPSCPSRAPGAGASGRAWAGTVVVILLPCVLEVVQICGTASCW